MNPIEEHWWKPKWYPYRGSRFPGDRRRVANCPDGLIEEYYVDEPAFLSKRITAKYRFIEKYLKMHSIEETMKVLDTKRNLYTLEKEFLE